MTTAIADLIARLRRDERPDPTLLEELLSIRDPGQVAELFAAAYEVKRREVTPTVYFRGLIEFSNLCAKDCLYCGIRRSRQLHRYTMEREEVLACARFAFEHRYGSIVLQSGERSDPAFVELVCELVREITDESGGRLAITLSCGEQEEATYRRWREAGAARYLLRIETSSRELYARLHPGDHSFEERLRCLRLLREIGYQVGTGVMIGLPFQTAGMLASDVLFFRDHDIDMIGMGPYLPHHATPLAADPTATIASDAERLELALRMIAVTRLVLPDVNIASTTALQSLDAQGRELGLQAGANVIMPNLTPVKYRSGYLLYDNKPCLDEDAAHCLGCLSRRIESIGERIGWDQSGDSLHATRRRSGHSAT